MKIHMSKTTNKMTDLMETAFYMAGLDVIGSVYLWKRIKNSVQKFTLDGKAVDICRNAAWFMGRSRISIVHAPAHIYESMFTQLIKLNNADDEMLDSLIEIALKDDDDFCKRINNNDPQGEQKINIFPGIGNKIDYEALKKTILANSHISLLHPTNIRPSLDTFYKGITAHTLIRENINPLAFEQFIGRELFIKHLAPISDLL